MDEQQNKQLIQRIRAAMMADPRIGKVAQSLDDQAIDALLRQVLQARSVGENVATQSTAQVVQRLYQTGDISVQNGNVAIGEGITQILIAPEVAYDVHGLSNPYLGLRSYTYSDRAIFAGRDRYVKAALAKLTDSSSPLTLLFITGASGSGKSSFAQAGIIPSLTDYYSKRGANVRYAVFRPSAQPLTALADALVQLGLASGLAADVEGKIASPAAFAQFVTQNTPLSQINLLLLDQFEELYSQSQSDQRDAVLDILANLPPIAELRGHLICTMRVDYLPSLFANKPLYDVATRQGIALRAMTVDELKEAIIRPAQVVHPDKRFEPALVDRLASDAAADASYLPLLQVTLEQLWKDGSLKLAAYHDLTTSIRQQAEDVYNYSDYDAAMSQPRSDADKAAILQIMLDLVQVSPDKDFADVRCRRERGDLVQQDNNRSRLIDDLVAARLLSSTTDASDKVQIDIIHESLIKNWERLQAAIKEQRQQLESRQRFESALDDWLNSKRSNDYLLGGVRLAEAKELLVTRDVATRSTAAQELVKYSEVAEQEERDHELNLAQEAAEAAQKAAVAARSRNSILRRAIAATLLLLAIAVIASGFAVGQSYEAGRQRDVAQAQATAANLAEREAQAQTTRVFEDQQTAEGGRLSLLAVSELGSDNTESAIILASEAEALVPSIEGAESVMLNVVGKSINPVAILNRHSDRVGMASFSPDGNYIVTASDDKTARVWDSSGGMVTVITHTEAVKMATFSPNGKSILTVSGKSAFLWTKEGKLLKPFPRLKSVNTAVFSPDGKRILIASDDATAVLWDIEDDNQVELPNSGAVTNALFSSSGDMIVTVTGGRNPIKLWNKDGIQRTLSSCAETMLYKVGFSLDGSFIVGYSPNVVDGWRVCLWQIDGTSLPVMTLGSPPQDVAFSPDNKYVAIAGLNGNVGLFSIETPITDVKGERQPNYLITGHTALVNHIVYSPDGKYILTASDDNTARLWAANGQPMYVLGGHTSALTGAVFSKDGRHIVTTSRDGTARLWEVGSELLTAMFNHIDKVNNAVYSPQKQCNDAYVATAGYNIAYIYDVSGSPIVTAPTSGQVYNISFSHDGCYAVTAPSDGQAQLIDIRKRAIINTFGGGAYLPSAIFSPDDSLVATAVARGHVYIWALDGKQPRATFVQGGDAAPLIAFSPNGKYLATAGDTPEAKLWDTSAEGTVDIPLQTFFHNRTLQSVEFSPNGENLLTASSDGTAKIWDISSGKATATLTHTDLVWNASFSHDGKSILTASYDGTAKLWDIQGNPLATMDGHNGKVWRAFFSPDDKYILTTASKLNPVANAETRLWDSKGTLLAHLPGLALGFSPDSSRFLVAPNNDTLKDFSIHEYPVRHDDLMKIAACRVAQGLTSQQQQQFGIDQPKFDIAKRTCPPSASWLQPVLNITPNP